MIGSLSEPSVSITQESLRLGAHKITDIQVLTFDPGHSCMYLTSNKAQRRLLPIPDRAVGDCTPGNQVLM